MDGHAKRWVVNPQSFLFVGDVEIKPLTIVDTYTYLRVQADPKGLRKAYSGRNWTF